MNISYKEISGYIVDNIVYDNLGITCWGLPIKYPIFEFNGPIIFHIKKIGPFHLVSCPIPEFIKIR